MEQVFVAQSVAEQKGLKELFPHGFLQSVSTGGHFTLGRYVEASVAGESVEDPSVFCELEKIVLWRSEWKARDGVVALKNLLQTDVELRDNALFYDRQDSIDT